MTRHGGRVLADQLVAQGVEMLFCVPGAIDLLPWSGTGMVQETPGLP